jgi:hypothetical protein
MRKEGQVKHYLQYCAMWLVWCILLFASIINHRWGAISVMTIVAILLHMFVTVPKKRET